MTDPTLQSRLDDALRDLESQRAELVRLREELRRERALREDAEGMVRVQCDELNLKQTEIAGIRKELHGEIERRLDAECDARARSVEIAAMGKVIGEKEDEIARLRDELRTLRNCRTVGDELGLKPSTDAEGWPDYRARKEET